jgi:6-pyruvoyltetrahydropterin 2'-reductase
MMIRLGEPIFRSVQGEGNRAGVLSVWLRFFGCNLKCQGFFQKDPTDPNSWEIPEALNNGRIYKSLKDVPILHTGCDSGYSWHPNFKHLALDKELDEVVDDIESLLYDGEWIHPVTKNAIDLCLTGGEPMMQQDKIIALISKLDHDRYFTSWREPIVIQIETNGTKKLTSEFQDFIYDNVLDINWNISPKLFNVSGEKNAVDYDVIAKLADTTKLGCLKFVVNNKPATWDELNTHVSILRESGVHLPIYIMPVGATYEQQTDTKILSEIANKAIDNGYHVSGRLQCSLFGNGVGT